jgi:hypothetical protein
MQWLPVVNDNSGIIHKTECGPKIMQKILRKYVRYCEYMNVFNIINYDFFLSSLKIL